MADYIPPTWDWVRKQVEEYEGSGGKAGTTLRDTGLPVIVVTYTGRRTGATRKAPLMRVVADDGSYVLVASKGGAPKNPDWYYSIKDASEVTIQDKERVFTARLREVSDPAERAKLWDISVKAYPPYAEYQQKTDRQIPVFVATPV